MLLCCIASKNESSEKGIFAFWEENMPTASKQLFLNFFDDVQVSCCCRVKPELYVPRTWKFVVRTRGLFQWWIMIIRTLKYFSRSSELGPLVFSASRASKSRKCEFEIPPKRLSGKSFMSDPSAKRTYNFPSQKRTGTKRTLSAARSDHYLMSQVGFGYT